MKLETFIQSALNFAEDSAAWLKLPNNFFTTDSNSKRGYRESSDNYNGGLDISWAFGLAPEIIVEDAPKHFIEQFQDFLGLVQDEINGGDNTVFETPKDVLDFLENFIKEQKYGSKFD